MIGIAAPTTSILVFFTKLKRRKTINPNDKNKEKIVIKVLIKAQRYRDKVKQKVCIGVCVTLMVYTEPAVKHINTEALLLFKLYTFQNKIIIFIVICTLHGSYIFFPNLSRDSDH